MVLGTHLVATAFELLIVMLPLVGLTFFKQGKDKLIYRIRLLAAFIRIQNVMLLVSLVTGAWLWGSFYMNWWLAVVVTLMLALGAALGFTSKALKGLRTKVENGEPYAGEIRQYLVTSTYTAALILGLVVFKFIF